MDILHNLFVFWQALNAPVIEGHYFGALMGWDDFIIMVIIAIVSSALAPKPKTQQPQAATIEDFEFPQADEGTAQAVIFGDCWTGGWMVLSYGDLTTTPIERG